MVKSWLEWLDLVSLCMMYGAIALIWHLEWIALVFQAKFRFVMA